MALTLSSSRKGQIARALSPVWRVSPRLAYRWRLAAQPPVDARAPLRPVPVDATPNRVHAPEVVLRGHVTLVRRQAIPVHRLGGILRHAVAVAVHPPKAELRVGITGFRPSA